ncbi:MAG TPA: hypothetical protein VKE70_31990 [Candidatus Solibacter sp.]|nr:hypothetical protein [Candidatus Solibacter sp.]
MQQFETVLNELNALRDIIAEDSAREPAFRLISTLVELYPDLDTEQRRWVTTNLSARSKFAMAQYTHEKADEALNTGARNTVIHALVPVAIAGGNADRPTGASLLSLVLHASRKAGISSREVFAYAAGLMPDEEQAAKVREFPLRGPANGIRSWGYSVSETPDGLRFKHAKEAPEKLTWWDRYVLGKRVTRAQQLEGVRQWRRACEKWEHDPPKPPPGPDFPARKF